MTSTLSERKARCSEPTFADMAADPIFRQYWDSQGITPHDVGQLLAEAAERLRESSHNPSILQEHLLTT